MICEKCEKVNHRSIKKICFKVSPDLDKDGYEIKNLVIKRAIKDKND